VQTGLAGKVVIVTAATANIGRGIALAFAAEGARVVIVGRDPAAGQLVAKLAREQGAADALWRPADMTVEDEVAGMVADTLAAFGQVDVLVNNVGGNVAVTRRPAGGLRLGGGHRADASRRRGTALARSGRGRRPRRAAGGRGAVTAAAGPGRPGRCVRGPGDELAQGPA
jgi:NAD(P)-dependent dehydrogenase (short-subunit alcohol dehydrogenase family)